MTDFWERLDHARRDIGVALPQTATGHYGSYTPLKDILQASEKPLRDQGLIIVNTLTPNGDGSVLQVAIQGIKDGQGEVTYTTVIPAGNPQQVGAAITYHRRYGLQCLLNITSGEDADNREPMIPATKEVMGDVPNLIDQDQTKQWALFFANNDKDVAAAAWQQVKDTMLGGETWIEIKEMLQSAVEDFQEGTMPTSDAY